MKRIAIAIALFASLAMPAVAQVYKCKEGGTTVFSAQPCGADAQKLNVRPAAGAGSYDPAAATANTMIATGRVAVGMTPAQVRGSWGAPNKINQSLYASGSTEQWIYYRDAAHIQAQYVHFRNGVVSSVYD